MGLIAAAAVAAVGAGVSAYMKNDAQRKAANSQIDALNNLEYLDPKDLAKQAKDQDLQKYSDQFAAQQKTDPYFADMRTQGAKNILQQLNADSSGNTIADQSLAKANSAADLSDKQNSPVIQGLIDQAKQDLASGASMPPEFEAQLVKAGLERAGAGGVNAGGAGATGSNTRRLLGTEGIALQQSRASEAQNLAGTAANLQMERQNALGNLLMLDNNLRAAKVQRGQTGAAVGTSSIPSIGLTGGDIVNMDVANTNQRNAVTMGKGALTAQKQLNNGQMWSSIIGSGTSLLTGALGGGFGSLLGGGGGATSASGGMMQPTGFNNSFIGGLFKSSPSNGIQYSSSVPSNGYGYGPN